MNNGNKKENKTGGLYSKINMSVSAANIMVASLTAVLVIALVFVIRHNGFTVKFDTDGGSYIQPVKVMHSEKLSPPLPYKEGYTFMGWYKDRDKTVKWDIKNDSVEGSMTLYAGWERKN